MDRALFRVVLEYPGSLARKIEFHWIWIPSNSHGGAMNFHEVPHSGNEDQRDTFASPASYDPFSVITFT